MILNPDKAVLFRIGPVAFNMTIVCSWFVMAILVGAAAAATRKLSTGRRVTRWQSLLETLVSFLRNQVREVMGLDPGPFIPFLGTLFLYILAANLLEVLPLYHPPTSSLSTTAALSVCVLLAVPVFGIRTRGFKAYFKEYVEPTPVMLPFHILGELTRTVSLSVRLFGNIMSESLVGSVILSIMPLFVPLAMQGFALLIGTIQAYIFFTLATVYIGSAAGSKAE
jgi:F-type H+-transporting ATPase subunit a